MGKIIKNEIEYSGSSSTNNDLIVVITLQSGTYIADKTYAEIIANIDAGGRPCVRYGNAFYQLDNYGSTFLLFGKHMNNNTVGWYIFSDGNISYFQNQINRVIQTTLSASGWSDGIYQLTNTYITANNIVKITYPDFNTITEEQLDAFSKAKIIRTFQVSGKVTLKARGTVPTIDIPITLIVEVV